ncbi:MAG TPA: hypothetical protein VLD63_10775 [Anaerolineales bacterium]|nr:hypothetical protein [Anaerolineales bacterium]
MSAYPTQAQSWSFPTQLGDALKSQLARIPRHRGFLFGLMLVGALFAFEAFNYGTTEFALTSFLGHLRFGNISAATLLALAFCGMDFAGIARLLTPGRGRHEPAEVWYLVAAWILAATMNAALTWWAVSVALAGQADVGNEIVGRQALLRDAPIFVAVLVWLIRVLMIGTFTLAGSRLFSLGDDPNLLLLRPIGPRRHAPSPAPVRPAPKPTRPEVPASVFSADRRGA